jgi:hypothetical protein
MRWWEGAANSAGQSVPAIAGTVEPATTGCAVRTDACDSGYAVAVHQQTHPHNRCILGLWNYACSTGRLPNGRYCADDDARMVQVTGYHCAELAADGLCGALVTHRVNIVGLCGCMCYAGASTPAHGDTAPWRHPPSTPPPPPPPPGQPCLAPPAPTGCRWLPFNGNNGTVSYALPFLLLSGITCVESGAECEAECACCARRCTTVPGPIQFSPGTTAVVVCGQTNLTQGVDANRCQPDGT